MRSLCAWLVLCACRQSAQDGPGLGADLARDPEISVHPAVATVLVVRWEQLAAGEAWLSWRFEGQEHRSPEVSWPPGPAHALILGLPAGAQAEDIALHVRAQHAGSVQVEQTVQLGVAQTGALPEELLEPTLAVEGPMLRSEPWLLTSVDVGPRAFYGPCYTVILDERGRIVWYRRSTGQALTWQVRPSARGGYLLVDELTTYVLDDPEPPVVIRLTLDLAEQQTIPLPGMMLVYDELPDGSFLHDERESDLDFHLSRRAPDGSSERLWSCRPWMAPYSTVYWACAPNSLVYNAQRQTVLWSTFRTNLILEIDPETGEVVREYGDYPGGPAVHPASSALHEPHGAHWTPQGTLMVSTHGPGQEGTEAEGETQWAREFEVDSQDQWREIWSAQASAWAQYGGQVQRLAGGQLLWQLGTAGIIQELTPDGQVTWQVEWPGHLVGHATPLSELYRWTEGITE